MRPPPPPPFAFPDLPSTLPPSNFAAMWDQRYASDDFVYGTQPNDFLAAQANLIAGPVLSLAEGEGRNAVFLASRGLEVWGVDSSAVGLAKAQRLAAERGVTIRTEVADLRHFTPRAKHFGSVVSIFAHLPSAIRARLYPLVEQALIPGGVFVLESYAPSQLARDTGGPQDPDMLPSAADLIAAFPHCDVVWSQELTREVVEGTHHTGVADVVQFIARKRA